MSLIHWWPLNGDIKDKVGLNHLTNTGVTFTTEGKIGQAAAFDNDNDILKADNLAELSALKQYSMSCWVYLSSTATNHSTAFLSSGNWNEAANQVCFGVYSYSNGYGTLLVPNNTGWSTGINISSNRVVLNKWYHIAIAYNGVKTDAYINGNYVGSYAGGGINSNTVGYYYLGGTTYYRGFTMKGYLNDFRIYDHALSQGEVKELSKALVVHYTFDDELIESTTNEDYNAGWSAYGSYWTIRSRNNHNLVVYRHSSSTNVCLALSNSTLLSKMAIGDTWTASMYLYKNGVPFKSSVGYLSSYKTFSSATKVEARDDGYLRVTFSVQANASGGKDSWIFHTNIFGSAAIDEECEIRNLQFEKKDHPTLYTSTSRAGAIYNETGLAQPEEMANIGLTTDAAIGKYAFQSNSSYIAQDSIGDGKHGATASMWIKMPLTSNWIAFVDAASGLGFGCYNQYGVIASVSRTDRRRVSNLSTLWKANDWNHVVVTISEDNKINRCWINSVEGSYGDPDHWTHNNDSFVIGSRYSSAYGDYPSTIKLDDFRLYYTCLSDDDIQRLYTSRGYVTNFEDICVEEFVEGENKMLVKKNGQCASKELWEYPQYVETSGSTGYFDTGYVPTSNDYSIELDVQIKDFSSFDTLAGFMYTSTTTPRCGIHIYSSKYMFGANTTINATTPLPADDKGGDRIVLKAIFKSGAQKLYRNNQLIASTSTTFNHSSNLASIWLLERNNYTASSGTSAPVNPTRVKLYSAKIYEGSTVVRHYVPWFDNGQQCLYDLCTNSFIYQTGSVTGPCSNGKQMKIYANGEITTRQVIEI